MFIRVHLWFKIKTLCIISAQSSSKSRSLLFSGLFYVAASRNNSPHVNSLVKTPSDVYPLHGLRRSKKATEAALDGYGIVDIESVSE